MQIGHEVCAVVRVALQESLCQSQALFHAATHFAAVSSAVGEHCRIPIVQSRALQGGDIRRVLGQQRNREAKGFFDVFAGGLRAAFAQVVSA